MIKAGVLRILVGVFLFVSVKGDEWGDGDGGDEFQCHILYEYDASTKVRVTSPFYGRRDEYHDGLWCEYRIRSPPGTRIKMTFEDMDISPSGSCMQDRLVVYGKDKDTVLGLFCGSDIPYPILSNEGENEIRLLIQTDFMDGGRGFAATFESGPNLQLCGPGQSVCGNRNCYDSNQKCDGSDQCGDGTDEENCGYPIVTSPTECGVTPIEPNTIFSDRMVGGDAAKPNSWPWQASLQTTYSEPNGHFCGGTLLNAQWVLTATHCVVGNPYPEYVKVHLGAHNKWKRSPYEQIRRAAKIIAYPNLEKEAIRTFSMSNDITLIKLNAPVTFNDGVQPACLAEQGWEATPGWTCYVTGWGESRGSGHADALKQQAQTVQTHEECSFEKDRQICVEQKNQSPCHGDSGGPLSCKLGGKWYVFGAASFVTTTNFISGLCTGPGAKTVYASAADKAEWIRETIEKYS